MGESFYSNRFNKKVWLTNHAIESMVTRKITLIELKVLIEDGEFLTTKDDHGWIFLQFDNRNDNLVCAAIVNKESIIIKTVMVRWQKR